jgi:membrane-associated phospholipid phosphatase
MRQYTFPSSEALMCIVIYGFLSYMTARHAKKSWFKTLIVSLSLLTCALVALSLIYLNLEYPSDVAAGFVFGGVWLSLNIILLEVYRILPEIKLS